MAEMTVFSKAFPPRNRADTGLDVLSIELEDALGKLCVDPNRAAVIGYTRSLPLTSPKWPSVLSGEPGFILRTSDLEAALTGEELLRLFRRDLRPDEVLKLLGMYGAFFEIHDDFYDEVTGEALQPMED